MNMRRFVVAGMAVSVQAFVAPMLSSTLPLRFQVCKTRGVVSLEVGKRPNFNFVDFDLRDDDDQVRAQAYMQNQARAAQETGVAEEQRFQAWRARFFAKRSPDVWSLMDRDSNGSVSFAEFAAAFGNKVTGIAKNLNLIDTVGNKIFGDLETEVSVHFLRRLYDELNKANTGRLTKDEFLFGSGLAKDETPSVDINVDSFSGESSFAALILSLEQRQREEREDVLWELDEIVKISTKTMTRLNDIQNESPGSEVEISKIRQDLEVKLKELRRTSLSQLEMIDKRMEKAFSQGPLSLEAWHEAFGVSVMSEAIFDYLDVNKDGKVSWEEFSNAMHGRD